MLPIPCYIIDCQDVDNDGCIQVVTTRHARPPTKWQSGSTEGFGTNLRLPRRSVSVISPVYAAALQQLDAAHSHMLRSRLLLLLLQALAAVGTSTRLSAVVADVVGDVVAMQGPLRRCVPRAQQAALWAAL